MQVRFEGPVVDAFQRIFAKIWEKETGEHLDSLAYHADPIVDDAKEIVLINREPRKLSHRMRRAYCSLLDAAKHEVRIVNPYPTNTPSVRRAMKRALRRGVSIKIMVSTKMDNHLTPEVLAIEMKKMARRGAEVFYYDKGFHHTKVITVDDSISVLGTTNLDGRSLRYDYEVSAFVFSAETTQQLNRIFDDDLQYSHRLTKSNFKKYFTLRRRVKGRVFQPVKGLL